MEVAESSGAVSPLRPHHHIVSLPPPHTPLPPHAGDENALAATAQGVRQWTNVSACASRDPESTSASWSLLRLEARGTDGRTLVLMTLSEAVEERYTAYFRLTSDATKPAVVPGASGFAFGA